MASLRDSENAQLWNSRFGLHVKGSIDQSVAVQLGLVGSECPRLARVFDRRCAARQVALTTRGSERARCATQEAFCYGRLESPQKTRRRFQLNVELPIPFGGGLSEY